MNEQKLDSILKIVSDTGQQVDLDTLPVFKDTLTINYDNFLLLIIQTVRSKLSTSPYTEHVVSDNRVQ